MGEGLWGRVVGQDAAIAVLRNAVARNEVAHAWLLVGQHGVGQDAIAAALAADLNCPEADTDGTACGTCTACTRIRDGVHPAARTFEPEGAEHVVGAVREHWIPVATRTLVEGRRRVLRVAEAERMNDGAQNAFLKVLEEPPAGLVWLLEAEDDGALLDTIASRCRRLDLLPWGPAELERRAEELGVPSSERAILVRAAMSSPQRLEVLARPGVAEARRDHLAIVGRLVDEGPGSAVVIAKQLDGWARDQVKARKQEDEKDLAELEESYGGEWPPGERSRVTKRLERRQREERRRALGVALDDLASYMRDLLAVRVGAEPLNLDVADDIRRDAQRLPPDAVLATLTAIGECADALDRQGQPELHLERLLLRLAAETFRATA